MISLHKSMGPGRDRTRDPWICSQTRICCQTRYRLRYAARLERVQKKDTKKGFYSTLFLVPKKNGKMRPVINLQPFNRYQVKKHFKLDSMNKVIQLVEKGDWSITLDLADAYFHLKYSSTIAYIFHSVSRARCFCSEL